MAEAPVALVEVTRRDRSGRQVRESLHHGHAVVADAAGNVLWSVGDPGWVTFVRSSVKAFQATACLELLDAAGGEWDSTRLGTDELAVSWASHAAQDVHLAAVRRLLARSGVEPEALTCPPDLRPGAPQDGRRRLHHNCSGKHALFALAGRAVGERGPSLLDPEGALQRVVLGVLEEVLGPFDAVGVDGCGAPAVAVPLARLATGFARLGGEDRWTRVREAALQHPVLVGGTERLESALLAQGVLAKPGAEGVFAAAWTDDAGRPVGLAVKVADGAGRAADVAARAILDGLGVPPTDWSPSPPLGGGRPAGVVRSVTDVDTVRLRE